MEGPLDHGAKTIGIVGNGPSIVHKVQGAEGVETQVVDLKEYPHPVWTMNGGWHYHPYSVLGFVMDDVRGPHFSKDDRAEVNPPWYRELIREAPIPVFSSRSYPDFPALVRYPIEDVVRRFKTDYFCETVDYMIAWAVMQGVEQIDLFGVDYTDGRKPHERACAEFWCGIAHANGVRINNMSMISTLLRFEPAGPEWSERRYGYLKDPHE